MVIAFYMIRNERFTPEYRSTTSKYTGVTIQAMGAIVFQGLTDAEYSGGSILLRVTSDAEM